MCWAFVLRRIVAGVAAGERERASAAMPTLQMIGYAIGAAASGIVANALGLTETAPADVVRVGRASGCSRRSCRWRCVGVAAAFRMARDPRHSPLPAGSP